MKSIIIGIGIIAGAFILAPTPEQPNMIFLESREFGLNANEIVAMWEVVYRGSGESAYFMRLRGEERFTLTYEEYHEFKDRLE